MRARRMVRMVYATDVQKKRANCGSDKRDIENRAPQKVSRAFSARRLIEIDQEEDFKGVARCFAKFLGIISGSGIFK